MRDGSLGPLVVAVHQLCVVGKAFIVTDVLVQGVSVVSCVKRTSAINMENAYYEKAHAYTLITQGYRSFVIYLGVADI